MYYQNVGHGNSPGLLIQDLCLVPGQVYDYSFYVGVLPNPDRVISDTGCKIGARVGSTYLISDQETCLVDIAAAGSYGACKKGESYDPKAYYRKIEGSFTADANSSDYTHLGEIRLTFEFDCNNATTSSGAHGLLDYIFITPQTS